MEAIEGVLLGIKGNCSWARDSPRNARAIEGSFAMDAISQHLIQSIEDLRTVVEVASFYETIDFSAS